MNSPLLVHSSNPPSISDSGVPVWQPDEQVGGCTLCGRTFTFFVRKHHCRRCGRVVCNSCSSHFVTYLPNTYVVCPATQIFLESPHIPHRTCDECAGELEMIRGALREDQEGTQGSQGTQGSVGQAGTNAGGPLAKSEDREVSIELSEDAACPVCLRSLAGWSAAQRETHVEQCIATQGFDATRARIRNRMLVYTIPQETRPERVQLNEENECIICFEPFLPGQRIGRLECLCCFHYHCIRDWVNHKGSCECPVHALHYD